MDWKDVHMLGTGTWAELHTEDLALTADVYCKGK